MNQGNDEYNKDDFRSATNFYTEGINVKCKDEELNAKLYSNRGTVQFLRGKHFFIHLLNFPFCPFYIFVVPRPVHFLASKLFSLYVALYSLKLSGALTTEITSTEVINFFLARLSFNFCSKGIL